jgi:hypothetical protein
MIKLDDSVEAREADIRLFTRDGEVLLTAARLFMTPGGGFAPVFVFQA